MASFCILLYEIAIPLGFIVFALYLQYNAYYSRKYVPHSITYTRNANFIKENVQLIVGAE